MRLRGYNPQKKGVKKLRNMKQKGFTLIELLVVIAIIGLLASVVLLSLNSARAKSRDAKRLADIRQLASALELYFNDSGAYPNSGGGTPLALTPNYIGQLPSNPAPVNDGSCAVGTTYNYTQTASGASYSYSFCLGATTGGYAGGAHTLSPAGIQ